MSSRLRAEQETHHTADSEFARKMYLGAWGAHVTTLHLMVGLPCAGKTTLACRLEVEHSALRLTPMSGTCVSSGRMWKSRSTMPGTT